MYTRKLVKNRDYHRYCYTSFTINAPALGERVQSRIFNTALGVAFELHCGDDTVTFVQS